MAASSYNGTGFDIPLDLPYTPAGQQIQPGEIWSFQAWFRDLDEFGASTANFSDALVVTFN
jgi:hypothetical protein